jgi:hypothetical protein
MDRKHSSQGLPGPLFGNFSELFATPSRLSGLQGSICTHWRVGLCGHRRAPPLMQPQRVRQHHSRWSQRGKSSPRQISATCHRCRIAGCPHGFVARGSNVLSSVGLAHGLSVARRGISTSGAARRLGSCRASPANFCPRLMLARSGNCRRAAHITGRISRSPSLEEDLGGTCL